MTKIEVTLTRTYLAAHGVPKARAESFTIRTLWKCYTHARYMAAVIAACA